MTVLGLLVLVLGIVVVGTLAYWIIVKFLPGSVHTITLAIVGALLLLVLLYAFFPGSMGERLW